MRDEFNTIGTFHIYEAFAIHRFKFFSVKLKRYSDCLYIMLYILLFLVIYNAVFVCYFKLSTILNKSNFYQPMPCMYIKLVEKMKISWKNSVSWGKWKSWLPWFQSIFRFFSQSKIDPIIWVLRFLKSKGGPFDDKNLKKIDFHVWYLKRTALKNVDWQWNRCLKILIFVEVMD